MAKKAGKGKKDGAKKDGSKKGKDGKGKKGKKKAVSLAPVAVKTGKGASVGEVAAQFVQMFNANPGQDGLIWDALFHKKFTSTEGGMRWEGRKAVEAKGADFSSKHEVNSCVCEGPYVGTTAFGVKYTVQMTVKADGSKINMSELAVYDVKDGKVVAEQFLYGMPG